MQRILMTICLAVIALPLVAVAADFSLVSHTIDAGGGSSYGATWELHGTVGQPDAGTLSGGNYTMVGGFWGSFTPEATCAGDVDQDGDADLQDLQALLDQFGASEVDSPADFDGDGDIDLSDLATLLGYLGQNCG